MKFIIIVIGILLLQHLGSLTSLQRDSWYRGLVLRLTKIQWLASLHSLRLSVSLLLPVFILVIMLFLLDDHWFGVPVLAVSFFVFLYSLGRGNLDEQVDSYRDDLMRDDLQAAFHDAAEFNPAGEAGVAEDWKQLHQEALEAISYRHFERSFAVMFWFVVAGAPGALLYRLMVLHQDMTLDTEEEKQRIRSYLTLMEWLPARLMGLSLAFVGNFTACLNYWRASLLTISTTTLQIMAGYVTTALLSGAVSDGAVERVSEVEDIKALFSRAMIFSLCMVAFLVMLI